MNVVKWKEMSCGRQVAGVLEKVQDLDAETW
jgi:hypothetical protein